MNASIMKYTHGRSWPPSVNLEDLNLLSAMTGSPALQSRAQVSGLTAPRTERAAY
jgi:hypothetical protein